MGLHPCPMWLGLGKNANVKTPWGVGVAVPSGRGKSSLASQQPSSPAAQAGPGTHTRDLNSASAQGVKTYFPVLFLGGKKICQCLPRHPTSAV